MKPPMADLPGIVVSARTPSVEEYLRLRVDAGLTPRSEKAAAAGLPNTFAAVVIENEGRAIGMGRVIGDGALFLQIVDIAVEPAFQGRGLGKTIMAALMAELRSRVSAEVYVSLIADGQANGLYAQFGFEPTAPKSIGMALWHR